MKLSETILGQGVGCKKQRRTCCSQPCTLLLQNSDELTVEAKLSRIRSDVLCSFVLPPNKGKLGLWCHVITLTLVSSRIMHLASKKNHLEVELGPLVTKGWQEFVFKLSQWILTSTWKIPRCSGHSLCIRSVNEHFGVGKQNLATRTHLLVWGCFCRCQGFYDS